MSSEIAIKVENLSKCYQIYDQPRDRLKQFVLPRLQRAVGLESKRYFREFWALKDVSFEVKKGETIGIIGRNGCGKSTLLQMICGTLNPTSGSIKTNGRIAALLELGSGFNPEFTGRENVYLNGAVLGLSKEEIDSRFDQIAAFADIGEFIEQPVKTYSSGMFVRLAFAIQANVEPEILIVDEALAVGDAYFVHKCMQRLQDLRDRGVSILFVSHDASLVKQLCSKAVWIHEGGIAGYGGASQVADDYLACLFDRQVIKSWSEPAATRYMGKLRHDVSDDEVVPETEIPNIDRRLGDQLFLINGISLRDETNKKISVVESGGSIRLRVTLSNCRGRGDEPIVFGYIIRNIRGVELASTNNKEEGFDIGTFGTNKILTLSAGVKLPLIQPGAYAICIAIGYIQGDNSIAVADRVDNAIVFEVHSQKTFHSQMIFETSFVMEGAV